MSALSSSALPSERRLAANRTNAQLKNLHLHENRLRRQYQQDAQELKELQAKRKQEQEE
jgi:hypothetical protein